MNLHRAIFAIVCCFNLAIASISAQGNPTVSIQDGRIVGETLKSTKGRQYSAFAGIPYAKPPIGDLRFEAPQPNEPWQEELKTSTANGSQCAGPDIFTDEILGQEDCLYINVYTPKLSGKIPVMVFIHGGGFNAGSGTFQDYGPDRFMDRDIVLVTFNYRLGPMGFLANPEQGLPGNNGLLDQIAALKWVQKNIESFGGDKSKVTIFGESAGGASVIYLVLSPLAKDLFHGAIAQSGSAICEWALNGHPSQCAKFLSIKLNCTTAPIEETLKCLRQKSWQDILEKNKEFEIIPMMPIIQKPNVDGKVVPDKPISLLQEGKVNNVPIMIGINTEEGALMLSMLRRLFPRTGEIFLKEDLGDVLSMFAGEMLNEKSIEEIREMYFKNVDLNNKTAFNKALVKVYSDSAFSCVQRTARYFANITDNPTYVYSFAYRGKNSLVQNEEGEELGVGHADELQYLFQNAFLPYSNFSGNDAKMSEIMLTLWTNFAKSHNPTPSDNTENGEKLPFTWPLYKPEDQKCIRLHLNPTIRDKCESEHTDYWMKDFLHD